MMQFNPYIAKAQGATPTAGIVNSAKATNDALYRLQEGLGSLGQGINDDRVSTLFKRGGMDGLSSEQALVALRSEGRGNVSPEVEKSNSAFIDSLRGIETTKVKQDNALNLLTKRAEIDENRAFEDEIGKEYLANINASNEKDRIFNTVVAVSGGYVHKGKFHKTKVEALAGTGSGRTPKENVWEKSWNARTERLSGNELEAHKLLQKSGDVSLKGTRNEDGKVIGSKYSFPGTDETFNSAILALDTYRKLQNDTPKSLKSPKVINKLIGEKNDEIGIDDATRGIGKKGWIESFKDIQW